MKPTLQINRTDKQRASFPVRRAASASPKVEYFFQAPTPEFSGHRRGESVSFRSISQDYFAREARGDFQAEALVFALVAATVLVPMIGAIRDLSQVFQGLI